MVFVFGCPKARQMTMPFTASRTLPIAFAPSISGTWYSPGPGLFSLSALNMKPPNEPLGHVSWISLTLLVHHFTTVGFLGFPVVKSNLGESKHGVRNERT